jgi:hypothetical protein
MKSTMAAGAAIGQDDSSPSPAAAAAAAASCERVRRAGTAIGRDDSSSPAAAAAPLLRGDRAGATTGRDDSFFYLCPRLRATSHRTGRLSFPLCLPCCATGARREGRGSYRTGRLLLSPPLRHECAATGPGPPLSLCQKLW